MTPIRTIETERLRMTPLTMADESDIQAGVSREEVSRYMTMPYPYPSNGAKTFLEDHILPKMADGRRYAWAIREKMNTQIFVGIIDYIRHENREGWGFGLWSIPEVWGRGYMTEAVLATHAFMFEWVGMKKLDSDTLIGNIGSERVHEKVGFKMTIERDLKEPVRENTREKHWEETAEMWQAWKASHPEMNVPML
jgi:[ribosomal protein S5]-alanine N-acetyltransferase